MTISEFMRTNFSRVTPAVAKKVCQTAKVSTRSNVRKVGRKEVDALYQAIQGTKIAIPRDRLYLPHRRGADSQGPARSGAGRILHRGHAPAGCVSRKPLPNRGRPGLRWHGAYTKRFQGAAESNYFEETDARTIRQFLIHTFNGLGSESADKIVKAANLGTRQTPSKLKPKEVDRFFEAMKNVNISEGQSMEVMRYANRVPLAVSAGRLCAVTQTVTGTNWRSYGLSQSRGSLPRGPVSLMVHIASVWVPFTSESKEAIANYPEIQKEIRLGLQAVGRKLGMYLRRRLKVKATDRPSRDLPALPQGSFHRR